MFKGALKKIKDREYTKQWRISNSDKYKEQQVRKNIVRKEKYALLPQEEIDKNTLRTKDWRSANPEKLKDQRKRQIERDPLRYRKNKLWYQYGMTTGDYDQMALEQNYSCAICGSQEKLHIDHYHIEGYEKLSPEDKKKYVRGLLCGCCNRGIGCLKDSKINLINAIKYLDSNNKNGE
jgi:hypothetical protein